MRAESGESGKREGKEREGIKWKQIWERGNREEREGKEGEGEKRVRERKERERGRGNRESGKR